METRISKWGNSRAVRVPREVLDRAGIDPDEPVTLSAEAGRIVIAPAKRKPLLAELLAQIKPTMTSVRSSTARRSVARSHDAKAGPRHAPGRRTCLGT